MSFNQPRPVGSHDLAAGPFVDNRNDIASPDHIGSAEDGFDGVGRAFDVALFARSPIGNRHSPFADAALPLPLKPHPLRLSQTVTFIPAGGITTRLDSISSFSGYAQIFAVIAPIFSGLQRRNTGGIRKTA